VKIVYWGKYIDMYLLDTLTHFEELADEPIHYALVEETFTRRQAKAQQLVDPSVNPLTRLPRHGFVEKSMGILDENQDAIHIFLSFWGDKRLLGVLLHALWRRHKVAVIFEPYSTTPHGYWKDEGWWLSHLKVLGRRIAYRMLWPILLLASRGKMPCILAVSPMAEEQLGRVGFPAEVIYPFGYCLERRDVEPAQTVDTDVLRILFSGSLIMRKGLDIAIAAIQQVNTPSVRVLLDIYGPGEISKYLKDDLPGIRYKGVYPQGDGQKIISAYDLLLVPSRHEGWGVVVNEALMQGVPVVVSDRVGAKTLLEHSGAGMLFRNEGVTQLACLLLDLSENPQRIAMMKSQCVLVRDLVTPQSGAEYLVQVFKHHFDRVGEKPDSVWSLSEKLLHRSHK